MSSARAAFSRNRAPYSAEDASSPRRRSSISSGSSSRSASGGGTSASGKWSAIPSSDQIDCTSRSSASRSRARKAIAHGACTRPPNGERMQTRQSPISSRKRSTTIVRSEGTTPVAASCSRRNVTRLRAASASSRVVPLDPLERCVVGERRELARGPADLLPELGRAADALALPERRHAGDSRGRRHEHAIPRDLLDPPGRRAEQERLALACLVHHLLVELAHAATAVGEEHAEQAAVGNRPRVRDREPLRPGAPAHGAGRSIPDDPRPQLGELVGRVAAGEHVEDVLELRA